MQKFPRFWLRLNRCNSGCNNRWNLFNKHLSENIETYPATTCLFVTFSRKRNFFLRKRTKIIFVKKTSNLRAHLTNYHNMPCPRLSFFFLWPPCPKTKRSGQGGKMRWRGGKAGLIMCNDLTHLRGIFPQPAAIQLISFTISFTVFSLFPPLLV